MHKQNAPRLDAWIVNKLLTIYEQTINKKILKKIKKFFQKTIDKPFFICYNKTYLEGRATRQDENFPSVSRIGTKTLYIKGR